MKLKLILSSEWHLPRLAALTLGMVLTFTAVRTVQAQNAYIQHNLVSDLAGMADHTDTNLVNPWGIAISGSSPFWISDNHSGLSTLYNSSGTPQSIIVTIPPPASGTPPAAPTGVVFNGSTNFVVSGSTAARFIFATEDGTISGWASGLTTAALKVDYSGSNAVYKGLAIATNGAGVYLYASDFHNGRVDVFDTAWHAATLTGTFADPTIPAGFAPFNIWNIGGQLYVSYAKQDASAHDDVAGPGNGFVNVFDTGGTLIKRLVSQGPLDSPWGLALAPASFGPFGGALLVGNFGDGTIHAFDPGSGALLGSLNDTNGVPFSVPALWALVFGNGGNGGDTHKLYFTAGIPGPDAIESHGLFGSLSPMFPAVISGVSYFQHNLVSDLAGMADVTDTNLVNPWGIAASSSSPFWISDNHSGLSTLYNSTGAIQSIVVTIPPPTGGTPPAAPTGVIFNGSTGFFSTGSTLSRFIFATEDGTISAWSSGLTTAVLKVDNSASNTVYKGLAIATNSGSTYLYASDFHNGRIDVFDSTWHAATLAGSFADPAIPAGFAPFNIQSLNGQIYVTYAKQDSVAHDDVGGPGNGFVNVFSTGGVLTGRVASQGVLNSPWGLAIAPPGFGSYAGNLLVGNFGDGFINVFDPVSGAPKGPFYDSAGDPLQITALWALAVGNGGNGGDAHTLYFTAGIPGPDTIESHGLFGSISPLLPTVTSVKDVAGNAVLTWVGGRGNIHVQNKTNLSDAAWTDLLTTTNHTASLPASAASGFFRLFLPGN